jgi:hypothetical protein
MTLGLMTYDPAFTNTASCRSSITFIDGERRHPALPGLSDRSAGGTLHLPRGGLFASVRRIAYSGRSEKLVLTEITHHTMLPEPRRSSWKAFTTMPTPWLCW